MFEAPDAMDSEWFGHVLAEVMEKSSRARFRVVGETGRNDEVRWSSNEARQRLSGNRTLHEYVSTQPV
jgi:hypothetical protein